MARAETAVVVLPGGRPGRTARWMPRRMALARPPSNIVPDRPTGAGGTNSCTARGSLVMARPCAFRQVGPLPEARTAGRAPEADQAPLTREPVKPMKLAPRPPPWPLRNPHPSVVRCCQSWHSLAHRTGGWERKHQHLHGGGLPDKAPTCNEGDKAPSKNRRERQRMPCTIMTIEATHARPKTHNILRKTGHTRASIPRWISEKQTLVTIFPV